MTKPPDHVIWSCDISQKAPNCIPNQFHNSLHIFIQIKGKITQKIVIKSTILVYMYVNNFDFLQLFKHLLHSHTCNNNHFTKSQIIFCTYLQRIRTIFMDKVKCNDVKTCCILTRKDTSTNKASELKYTIYN